MTPLETAKAREALLKIERLPTFYALSPFVATDLSIYVTRVREALDAAPSVRVPVEPYPLELFDSYSVLQELTTHEQQRTSADNVNDVLNAVVRLMRKRLNAPPQEIKP